MKLRAMKVGSIGAVSKFTTSDPQYRQKLLRMGLTRSAEFKVVRKAPFGGPIEIEVKGSRLVLRSDEADAFEVETK
ncbi:FeoA family protein [Pontiellaceae bacterium B1224]|nr:FeoA family protein [Pontiellaceae bacterium B1224]